MWDTNDIWEDDFCLAVIDASNYWDKIDESLCPALKYLRTVASYYLWLDERPSFFELAA